MRCCMLPSEVSVLTLVAQRLAAVACQDHNAVGDAWPASREGCGGLV